MQGRKSPAISDIWVGSPTAARCRATRSASEAGKSPRRAERAKASAIPTATPSPCNKPVGKTGRRLQRVAESMPEVEQRAFAAFAFVAGHGAGLGPAAHGDRMLARRPARKYIPPIGFEPGEKAASPSSPYSTTSA